MVYIKTDLKKMPVNLIGVTATMQYRISENHTVTEHIHGEMLNLPNEKKAYKIILEELDKLAVGGCIANRHISAKIIADRLGLKK